MTAAEMMEAHPAVCDERSQVITTLCRAFFDDRIYRWLIPDDTQRRRSAVSFYSRFVDACWLHGGVYAAGGGAGAALWVPPGNQLVPDEQSENFGRGLWRRQETPPLLPEWNNCSSCSMTTTRRRLAGTWPSWVLTRLRRAAVSAPRFWPQCSVKPIVIMCRPTLKQHAQRMCGSTNVTDFIQSVSCAWQTPRSCTRCGDSRTEMPTNG